MKKKETPVTYGDICEVFKALAYLALFCLIGWGLYSMGRFDGAEEVAATIPIGHHSCQGSLENASDTNSTFIDLSQSLEFTASMPASRFFILCDPSSGNSWALGITK